MTSLKIEDNRADQSFIVKSEIHKENDEEEAHLCDDQQIELGVASGVGEETRFAPAPHRIARSSGTYMRRVKKSALRKIFSTNKMMLATLMCVCLVIALVAVIVHTVNEAAASSQPKVQLGTFEAWSRRSSIDFEEVLMVEEKCGRRIDILSSGAADASARGDWKYFTKNETDWQLLVSTLQIASDHNISHTVLSPFYNIPADTCGVNLKYEHMSLVDDVTIALRNRSGSIATIMTSQPNDFGPCRQAILYREDVFRRSSAVQIAMPIMTSRPEADRTSFTLRFLHCNTLRSLERSDVRKAPNRADSHHDECDFEFESDRKCNWLTLQNDDVTTARFRRRQSAGCINSGLVRDKDKYFVALTPAGVANVTTSGLLVSPLMRRFGGHVTLSYYYQMLNLRSSISVYVVDEFFDLGRLRAPDAQLAPDHVTVDWTFDQPQLAIPAAYQRFHIVIEGKVEKNEQFENRSCKFGSPTPLIAIDEIRIQFNHDQCSNSSGSDVLDCNFNEDLCLWNSSINPFESDWQTTGEASAATPYSSHGLLNYHLKDRGNVLKFHAGNNVGYEETYLRSPIMVANSNCSCTLTLFYLLRGEMAPRITVAMVYASNQSESNRPYSKLWSAAGHKNDQWMENEVIINLRHNSDPFQFEIQITEVEDVQSVAHLDDIRFLNCDVSFYEEENNYEEGQ